MTVVIEVDGKDISECIRKADEDISWTHLPATWRQVAVYQIPEARFPLKPSPRLRVWENKNA